MAGLHTQTLLCFCLCAWTTTQKVISRQPSTPHTNTHTPLRWVSSSPGTWKLSAAEPWLQKSSVNLYWWKRCLLNNVQMGLEPNRKGTCLIYSVKVAFLNEWEVWSRRAGRCPPNPTVTFQRAIHLPEALTNESMWGRRLAAAVTTFFMPQCDELSVKLT